ncbi:putative pre-mRNA-splicing factor CWC22 [Monocercomonoides exilis]|nr:putative pre-mRNA-splicing factor CWC22 [Monocercomonoides exilis]
MKEVGSLLTEIEPAAVSKVFDSFRELLQEGEMPERVEFVIERLMAVRKRGFKEHPSVAPELNIVSSEDQITHNDILLDSPNLDPHSELDVFRFEQNYQQNNAKYEQIKRRILEGAEFESESGTSEDESDGERDEEAKEEEERGKGSGGGRRSGGGSKTERHSDSKLAAEVGSAEEAEQKKVESRKKLYLLLTSSTSADECTHNILSPGAAEGMEMEVALMLIECCAQERAYNPLFHTIAQKLCLLDRVYQEALDECFVVEYGNVETGQRGLIARADTKKIQKIGMFFGNLLALNALPWAVLEYVKLSEADTTPCRRIFLKYMLQTMQSEMGLEKLQKRLDDETMGQFFVGLFPMENPRSARFAIRFFEAIGLRPLIHKLEEHVQETAQRMISRKGKREGGKESESECSDESSDESRSRSTRSSESKCRGKCRGRGRGRGRGRSRERGRISKGRRRISEDNSVSDSEGEEVERKKMKGITMKGITMQEKKKQSEGLKKFFVEKSTESMDGRSGGESCGKSESESGSESRRRRMKRRRRRSRSLRESESESDSRSKTESGWSDGYRQKRKRERKRKRMASRKERERRSRSREDRSECERESQKRRLIWRWNDEKEEEEDERGRGKEGKKQEERDYDRGNKAEKERKKELEKSSSKMGNERKD